MTFFFYFHCKLYLVVESVEVVQKFCQLFLATGPDDESIIYISEPAYRFVCRLFYCFLLKILHEEIRNYRRKGGVTMGSQLSPVIANFSMLLVCSTSDAFCPMCSKTQTTTSCDSLQSLQKKFLDDIS